MPTLRGEKREGAVAFRQNGQTVEYVETWHYSVLADSDTQGRHEIIATEGLPKVNITISPSGIANCRSVTASRDPKNPLYWDVTVEFSTPDSDSNGGGNVGNPVEFRVIAEVQFDLIDEVSEVDADSSPVVNSAGQPFETGFVIKKPVTHFVFTQYEPATLSLHDIRLRNGVINSSAFPALQVDPFELLLLVQSAELGTYWNYRCWRIKYKLSHKDGGWKTKRLDVGTSYITGGELLPYLDNRGQRILGNLNGFDGNKSGDDGKDPPGVLEFTQYEESDFSFIRL